MTLDTYHAKVGLYMSKYGIFSPLSEPLAIGLLGS